MIKKEKSIKDRHLQMNFSLTPNYIESFIQLCKKYNIIYSKMLKMFIDYFVDNPTELKEAVERYF